eukprot:11340029-Prorocentrum_lima.AAC.1
MCHVGKQSNDPLPTPVAPSSQSPVTSQSSPNLPRHAPVVPRSPQARHNHAPIFPGMPHSRPSLPNRALVAP